MAFFEHFRHRFEPLPVHAPPAAPRGIRCYNRGPWKPRLQAPRIAPHKPAFRLPRLQRLAFFYDQLPLAGAWPMRLAGQRA